ncbi:DNA-directed RNA polymerase sigma-70 factor [Haloferula helveola]|uniref:DNA-directed RNA polymerase sigma-70 factor n=1 Tax=Haloferula helveola TaxID=490095 RepID=A0ABM7RFY1_9BACT|nr:DNA-directed RNA polymerase sigma-70 factor [Haloferula helveola]
MRRPGGDEDAGFLQEYVKLMTDHQWPLRGFILSLMPGSPDVGDVLQETNLVLWQKRKQFKLGTNFLAWACRIARYEVMHHRDRVRKHAKLPFSDEMINVLAAPKGIDASHERLLTALEGCLAKLGDKQRALIEHRYTPGKSLEAHAQTLGTTAGSLRVTLHRVRQALRRCVKETLAGGAA